MELIVFRLMLCVLFVVEPIIFYLEFGVPVKKFLRLRFSDCCDTTGYRCACAHLVFLRAKDGLRTSTRTVLATRASVTLGSRASVTQYSKSESQKWPKKLFVLWFLRCRSRGKGGVLAHFISQTMQKAPQPRKLPFLFWTALFFVVVEKSALKQSKQKCFLTTRRS